MAFRPNLILASLSPNPCRLGGETGFREGGRMSDEELYVMIVSNMGSFYRRPRRCLYGRLNEFPHGAPLANQSFKLDHARKSAAGIPEDRLPFHPPQVSYA
ncbi:uncharacterized protein BDW47DRAFT_120665 [Aspergillus candidus]|uniref:Uncharacterized protein n=1 Tax=Aspergillus candidus TaxID=41067 RepID=A0A2I2F091_ASPCN|nr:hypothetical protein BDW47DRAFT_120665 [Aspergillus candidus]PLB34047.1 hypothetical protein BDW47DRAFT_120665 [Aspergillus candidus]